MNKRLRKKKHLGEFRELGFLLRFQIDPALSTEARDALIDRWLQENIEAHGLSFGGGGLHAFEGFVCRADRGSATDAHRAAVASWLAAQPGVTGHAVFPLVDAWYGHEKADEADPATLKR